jgi:hypothetical protein
MTLITPEYKALLEEYRTEAHRPMWGNGGGPHVQPVVKLIEKNPGKFKKILDYGCGHGLLLRSVLSHNVGLTERQAQFYDPGIEKFSELPHPAHLVLCTDVLEHIEPECLDSVLEHLHGAAPEVRPEHEGRRRVVAPVVAPVGLALVRRGDPGSTRPRRAR